MNNPESAPALEKHIIGASSRAFVIRAPQPYATAGSGRPASDTKSIVNTWLNGLGIRARPGWRLCRDDKGGLLEPGNSNEHSELGLRGIAATWRGCLYGLFSAWAAALLS